MPAFTFGAERDEPCEAWCAPGKGALSIRRKFSVGEPTWRPEDRKANFAKVPKRGGGRLEETGWPFQETEPGKNMH